jgi:hypothetical protein
MRRSISHGGLCDKEDERGSEVLSLSSLRTAGATSVKVVYERLRSIRLPDAQLAMS